ncbi:hypothetical protein QYF36_017101 [Acer negundo]|nr:hypothetical protein QYF36_017101 [Acer negundo]
MASRALVYFRGRVCLRGRVCTLQLGRDLGSAGLRGPLVPELGVLRNLQYLRLNNNNLTGSIPTGFIQLIFYGNLRIMNVANNSLAGTVHPTKSTRFAVTTITQDPRAQK